MSHTLTVLIETFGTQGETLGEVSTTSYDQTTWMDLVDSFYYSLKGAGFNMHPVMLAEYIGEKFGQGLVQCESCEHNPENYEH